MTVLSGVRVARARWAVTLLFATSGIAIASLVVRMPSLKLDHDLTEGGLGTVNALFGVMAVITMQVAGRVSARFGSSPILRFAAALLPVALVGVGAVEQLWQLAAVILVAGVAVGTLDVTMNTHAIAVERALGRPIMNGCHAAWSIGAVIGSLAGGAAAQAGWTRATHYAWLAVVLVATALVVGPRLLGAAADRQPTQVVPGESSTRAASGPWTRTRPRRPSGRTGWTRQLLVLGSMGAIVLTCEAAVANWSGVFLHEHHGASLGFAAAGFFAFTACQTAMRLVGDRVYAHVAAPTLLRLGSVVAAAGFVLVVVSPSPPLAVAGFAAAGLGLATGLPVLYSVVGRIDTQGAPAPVRVARFTTMTYSGILLAPAIIGWSAQAFGLSWTLAALVPLLITVAYHAPVAGRR